ITLLVPFVPAALLDDEAEARLLRVLAQQEPFDYWLDRGGRGPGGLLYPGPQPSVPFAELTEALMVEFPDYPPYGGAHDEVIPHATVAVSDDRPLLDRIAHDLEAKPPTPRRGS